MKRKVGRICAATVGVLLSAVVAGNVIGNSTLEAQAAETLQGINQLISDVKTNAESTSDYKYTILEVVPDIKDAEIGYMFGGYEPLLSEHKSDGRWIGWKEQLANVQSESEREALINKFDGIYQNSELLKKFVTQEKLEGNGEVVVGKHQQYGKFELVSESTDPNLERYNLTFIPASSSDTQVVRNAPVAFFTTEVNKETGNGEKSILDTENNAICYYGEKFIPITKENISKVPLHASIFTCKEGVYIDQKADFATLKDTITKELDKTTNSGSEPTTENTETVTNSETGVENKTSEANSDQKESTEQVNSENKDANVQVDENAVQKEDSLQKEKNKKSTEENKVNEKTTEAVTKSKSLNGKTDSGDNTVAMVAEPAQWLTAVTLSEKTEAVQYFYKTYEANGGTDTGKFVVSTITSDPNGEYVFVKMDESTIGGQFYTFEGKTIKSSVNYKNTELFRKSVLNMDDGLDYDKEFPVEVITLTYEDISKGDLPNFDFVYFKGSPSTDLEVTKLITLFKSINNGMKPCVLDGVNLFDGNGNVKESADMANFFKFSLMLAQDSLTDLQFDKVNEESLKQSLARGYESGTFVTEHVYVTKSSVPLYENFDSLISSTIGFDTVKDAIELENSFRIDEGKEPLPVTISKATAVRHILNFQNRRDADVKKKISIMEIHPAYQSDKTIDSSLKKWAPGVENLSVQLATSAELNSRIESLNDQFDLIYIGASKQHMNVDSNTGETVYNDSQLDGYIYHTTGDSGYNGNDISLENKNEILRFIEADYPVIISADLVNQDGIPNDKHVEKSSNMFALLNEIIKRDNVFIDKNIPDNDVKLQLYLNQPRIHLANVEFSGTQRNGKNYYEVVKNGEGYELNYTFTIKQDGIVQGDENYSVELYFDFLGDGRYNDVLDFKSQVKSNGDLVDSKQLKANTEYTLECIIPKEYAGCIGNKLVVKQTEKNQVYTTMTYFIKLMKSEIDTIKILQIGGPSANTLDLEANLLVSNSDYYLKAQEIGNEYKFDVKHCTIQEFGDYIHGNSNKNIEANPMYLNQFDVLVVGFFDDVNLGIITDNVLIQSIANFIKAGKGVLFTGRTGEIQKQVFNNAVLKDELFSSNEETYSKINVGKNGNYKFNVNDLNKNTIMSGKRLLKEPNIIKTNESIITNYPFNVGVNFKIGQNQAFDARIDPTNRDISVWYCFDTEGSNHSMYSLSPKDGANNYYLYSQKNVLTTGFTGASDCTDEELCLFYNSLVAAYERGIKSPDIKVFESDKKNAEELTVIYRLFDESLETNGTLTADGTTSEKIYFTVEDKNHGTTNLELNVRFLASKGKANTGTVEFDYHGNKIKGDYFAKEVHKVEDNSKVEAVNNFYPIESGKMYYVTVEKTLLADCEKGLELYFEANSKFMKGKQFVTPEPSFSKVDVMRIYLFDLK